MKRTLLVSCTLVVATMGFSIFQSMLVMNIFGITMNEFEICYNQTNITIENMMKFDKIMLNDIQTTDSNSTAFKIGCLLACLGKKKEMVTGSHINIDKIKEIMYPKIDLKPEEITYINQILKSCANRVRNKTSECEASITFALCLKG